MPRYIDHLIASELFMQLFVKQFQTSFDSASCCEFKAVEKVPRFFLDQQDETRVIFEIDGTAIDSAKSLCTRRSAKLRGYFSLENMIPAIPTVTLDMSVMAVPTIQIPESANKVPRISFMRVKFSEDT